MSVYCVLSGRVAQDFADSIDDEVKQQAYFKVIVENDRAFLLNSGKCLPIKSCMICDVEILTGRFNVLSYLLKPAIKRVWKH